MRVLALIVLLIVPLHAQPVRVAQVQGEAQGFLVIRDAGGRQIGTGNLQQSMHGMQVTSRFSLSLDDGSIDSETTVFSQAQVFHVISDHHVQNGPLFQKALDVSFETESGDISTRNPDRSETKEHQKTIPDDIANGITGTVLLNVKPNIQPFRLSMIAPDPKGRIISILISAEGEGDFSIGGTPHKAMIFRIHPEVGGLAGVVAPLVGKEPKDAMVWVVEGSAPVIVREIAQLSAGGPILSIELAGTHFEPLKGAPEAAKR